MALSEAHISLSKNNFDFQQVIGRGGFGRVSKHLKISADLTLTFIIGVASRIPQDKIDLCDERDG